MKQHQTIVLASASPSRRRLLTNAGLAVQAVPAEIDESALRSAIENDHGNPADLALALADAKAADVAARMPMLPVVGADQILMSGGERFDKASDMAAAAAQLNRLQGHSHDLISAVTLHQGNNVLWSTVETATLTMRPLTADDIERYLARVGDDVLGSVGCYHLEGKGAWLFERVDGDFFTVLGLPLLALLETLRRLGIVS